MTELAYKVKPITFCNDIPVFSEENTYTENYKQIAKDHLSALKETGKNPFIPEDLWKEIEDSTAVLIKKYSRSGQKMLDVGVGLGRLMENFSELDRYGVDISLEYLKLAKEKGINCCCAQIEQLPYSDNFFDFIVCTDVLEHVLDINLAIKNILRVLKKDGLLVIRVPYRENLSGYLDPSCPYYYVHIRNFDEDNLRLLFTRVFNCTILEWTTAGTVTYDEKIKRPYPEGRLARSLTYRYHLFLKRYFPEKFKTLFYPSEINMVIRKTSDGKPV